MPWLTGVLFVYALINISLGVFAFYHAHSVFSLVGGVGSGMLVIAGMAWAKTNQKAGYILITVVSLLLLGKFGGSFVEKHDIYPSGILGTVALIALICLIVGHFQGLRPAPVQTPDDQSAKDQ